MKNEKFLAIVPARGGSKGLPRKNVLDLGGKPLLHWTVRAGLDAAGVDRLVVSTDDEEIAEAARAAGAEVPFLRPARLAQDASGVEEAIAHALEHYSRKENVSFGHVLLLQPTSPLRTSRDIEEALALYDGNRPVVSVTAAPEKAAWLMRAERDGSIRFCFQDAPQTPRRRQELPRLYYPNGALYVAPAAAAARGDFFTDLTRPYEMPEERSLDIDSLEDLARARKRFD